MASPIEILVPDIGGFKDVNVIDVLVKDGQQIEKETPLVTIETEKAAMDVPAPSAGKIAQVKLKTGDKVSEGSLILLLEPAGAAAGSERAPAEKASAPADKASAPAEKASAPADKASPPAATASSEQARKPAESPASPEKKPAAPAAAPQPAS